MSRKNIKLHVNKNDLSLLNLKDSENDNNNYYNEYSDSNKKNDYKSINIKSDDDSLPHFYPTVNVNIIKTELGGNKKNISRKPETKKRKILKRDLTSRKRSNKKYTISKTKKIIKKKSSKRNKEQKKNRKSKKSIRKFSRKTSKKNKRRTSKKRESIKKNNKIEGSMLWTDAIKLAREKLNIIGFQPIKKDTELYNEAKKIYENSKL